MKARQEQIDRFLRKVVGLRNGLIEDPLERLVSGLRLNADLISSVDPQSQKKPLPENKSERRNLLRENLLQLTKAIAQKYKSAYDENAPPSTKAICDFEKQEIDREITGLSINNVTGTMIDLGCANGRISFSLSKQFGKIIGVDVSPDMIEVAKSRKMSGANFNLLQHMEFQEHDLENGLPFVNNATVSLAVMNLGTGSDIQDTNMLLHEISRVLKPNGRFFISFYNSSALFCDWPIPWPLSLGAEINTEEHCLDVHFNKETFRIHARPFTIRELTNLFGKITTLSVSKMVTFPTVMSILPDALLSQESADIIKNIDGRLLNMGRGAYILVSGCKKT